MQDGRKTNNDGVLKIQMAQLKMCGINEEKRVPACPVLCIVDPVGYSVMKSDLYVSNDRSGF